MVVASWEHTARANARHAAEALRGNWQLGFTAFGGPPVHFKIFHDKFVQKLEWIDEQMYQELFSICQALSGPASTKMLYCINLIHNGLCGALVAFLVWSLPGALSMCALSLGVSSVGEALPRAVYALLSGLNAATVGIIALAAVELSDKAITDKLTRVLVFLAASAGLLYNALWYFPVLMVLSGCAAVAYDSRLVQKVTEAITDIVRPRSDAQVPEHSIADDEPEERIVAQEFRLGFSWKQGIAIIVAFFAVFLVVMVTRGVLTNLPLLYRLFANMYLAGTIIFGGGPVVIPLLREYVVAEGWVSPRDFLIGLAVIQALPGPNFNFAVYLGSLTAINGGHSIIAGAVIAFIGIFTPGMVLVHGTMGIWGKLRSRLWVKSVVRGVNAAAVGLVYTAVYRIWQVGYVDSGFQSGRSLGDDPWWVVVTATAYVGGRYFGLVAPVAIILGAILGLVRYGVVSSSS
ncbi:hypothetical protein TruAng_000696 [Truncatella angustata]|nr:hypothetical protein TruAng_000696 [Truncatella angustata]